MMLAATILLLAVSAVRSQIQPVRDYRGGPYYDETPKPYSFSYNSVMDDGVGQMSRTETSDASGRVQGSYTLVNEEGHTRVVDYVADQDGFRAHVRTNEPGTDNQNPADVIMESTSDFARNLYNRGNPVVAARRPFVAPEPVGPEIAPIDPARENVLPPVRRPVYRRPQQPVYRRPAVRNPYGAV